MSIAIISIVMVATTSAIILASRAMPGRADVSSQVMQSAKVWEQIEAELRHAISVTELTPTAITFTVSDRNGDFVDEIIRYSWSGTAGHALLRRYNGGADVSIVENVHEFQVAYDRLRELLPVSYDLSSEQVLFSYTSSTNLEDYPITSTNWIGQFFRPTMPANASWWRVTRVIFQAKSRGTLDGEARVQVRAADGSDRPTNTVFDQAVLLENTLGTTQQLREVILSRDARLTPGSGACIVFQWVKDFEACEIRIRGGMGEGGMSETINGGSSWGLPAQKTIPIEVRGVIATPRADQYRYTLTNVRMLIRCGSDPATRFSGGVRMLNSPQVTAP